MVVSLAKENIRLSGQLMLPDLLSAHPQTRAVFDRYGLGATVPAGYNVDHLIPPGLGGSNDIRNLWPQPLSGKWNYFVKNELERHLRKRVCRGELDLQQARKEIAADWINAYRKYLGEPVQR